MTYFMAQIGRIKLKQKTSQQIMNSFHLFQQKQ